MENFQSEMALIFFKHQKKEGKSMNYVNLYLFQTLKQGKISYISMTERQQLAMDEIALGEITSGALTQEEYDILTGKGVGT